MDQALALAGGREKLAKEFGVTPGAISQWRKALPPRRKRPLELYVENRLKAGKVTETAEQVSELLLALQQNLSIFASALKKGSRWRLLGEILVAMGAVTKDQVRAALEKQMEA